VGRGAGRHEAELVPDRSRLRGKQARNESAGDVGRRRGLEHARCKRLLVVVTAAMAGVVYEWMGLAFLRRGWINLDRIWIAVLTATGLIPIV
jgi:hypothetical protein